MSPCNEYLIQVSLNEHYWDNPSAPYHWCILGHYENWCNEASGWATSIDQAFEDAKRHYNNILFNTLDTNNNANSK